MKISISLSKPTVTYDFSTINGAYRVKVIQAVKKIANPDMRWSDGDAGTTLSIPGNTLEANIDSAISGLVGSAILNHVKSR